MLFKPPQTPLGRETPGDSSLSCLLRQEPPSGKSLHFPLRSHPGLWEDCEGESLGRPKSEVCLKHAKRVSGLERSPGKFPAAIHTLTQPLPAAAQRGHRPLPPLSASPGLMQPQAGAQGVGIRFGIFYPWLSYHSWSCPPAQRLCGAAGDLE